MNPGKLRHRVTIQRMADTVNSINETVQAPQDYITVWASFEPVTGREYMEMQTIRPELTYKAIMRYHVGITPDMLLKFRGRLFEITDILNAEERNRELQIMCIEKVRV
jgi:SPP1 family predicted phage head-tail adaptor